MSSGLGKTSQTKPKAFKFGHLKYPMGFGQIATSPTSPRPARQEKLCVEERGGVRVILAQIHFCSVCDAASECLCC